MGYWNANAEGDSLQVEDTGIVWGDTPADLLEDALDAIVREFIYSMDRKPTKTELRAGLEFALGGDAWDLED